MKLNEKANVRHLFYGIILVALIFFPIVFNSTSVLHVAVFILIYVILALGLEVALGITGLFSLCHAAFYGMGAYISAILALNFGWSFWITMPVAAVGAGLFGMLIGLPSLRTNGDYLAIATLGFGEIFRLTLINGGELTRGPRGLPSIPRPELFGLDFSSKTTYYYLLLIVAAIVFLVVLNIPRTFFGRALMAIRDDETAASFMGINVPRFKVIAFGLSGLVAGIAGAFYAHYITFISPDTFLANDSNTFLMMVLLGGSGTVIGPVIGAVVLTILPELLRDFIEYRLLIYGLIVVIMMQVRANGIVGGINTRKSYIESLMKSLKKADKKGV